MTTIVGGNTSLTVRMIEQRIGRTMTEHDLEILTLASARKAQKTTATDYVAAQLAAFQISRGLATFFETCDVFLSPTLCAPPLRIGEIDTMAQDLSHIAPILRRHAGASMFACDFLNGNSCEDDDAAAHGCARAQAILQLPLRRPQPWRGHLGFKRTLLTRDDLLVTVGPALCYITR
jgi:hypothetical protein